MIATPTATYKSHTPLLVLGQHSPVYLVWKSGGKVVIRLFVYPYPLLSMLRYHLETLNLELLTNSLYYIENININSTPPSPRPQESALSTSVTPEQRLVWKFHFYKWHVIVP